MEMREQESMRLGKSLHSPFLPTLPTLSSYSFLSVSNRVVSAYSSNLDDRLFEITAPTESLSAEHGRHQSNHHPGTEARTAIFFYANGKFFLFLQWTIAAYLGSKFLQLDYSCITAPTFSTLT